MTLFFAGHGVARPRSLTKARCWPKKTPRLFDGVPGSMPIVIQLDVMLRGGARSSRDLAEHVGITQFVLAQRGKVKGVRFDTLERIQLYLECQPGDLWCLFPGAAPG